LIFLRLQNNVCKIQFYILSQCEKISFNWLQLTCGVVTPQLGYYRDIFQNNFLCTVTVHQGLTQVTLE
jgi:hypothetical protein